jgi:hypothetical protein
MKSTMAFPILVALLLHRRFIREWHPTWELKNSLQVFLITLNSRRRKRRLQLDCQNLLPKRPILLIEANGVEAETKLKERRRAAFSGVDELSQLQKHLSYVEPPQGRSA